MNKAIDEELQKLARQIAAGFEDTNGRIESLEKKMMKRFDSLDDRLVNVEVTLLRDHERRIRALEGNPMV